MAVDVLTVSSKGQIVLPAPIRKAMSISAGDKLAACATGGLIVLKPISVPDEADFKAWLDEAAGWAEASGLGESEVDNAIAAVRARRRS